MLLFVTCFSANNAKCQNIPKPGSNVPHPSLDKFVGNWISVNNTDTIWLKLKKENIMMPSGLDYSEDVIVGYYRYVKGKNLVFDSFKYFDQKFSKKHNPFIAWPYETDDVAKGGFNDVEKNKSLSAMFTISKDRRSLEIVLSDREGLRIGAKEGNSLPLKMLFTKK